MKKSVRYKRIYTKDIKFSEIPKEFQHNFYNYEPDEIALEKGEEARRSQNRLPFNEFHTVIDGSVICKEHTELIPDNVTYKVGDLDISKESIKNFYHKLISNTVSRFNKIRTLIYFLRINPIATINLLISARRFKRYIDKALKEVSND